MSRLSPEHRAEIPGIIARQVRAGADPSLACLHIPKTGGTSLSNLIDAMRGRGMRAPLYLPHRIGLDEAVEFLPEARLVVVLRDPLERMASGFLSRLRKGRPRYDIPWTAREDEAFANFPAPEAFFRALISEDAEQVAAARRAIRAIVHLRRGYASYFGSAARVRAEAARFALIGEIGAMRRIVEGLARLLDHDPAAVLPLYAADHVAPVGGGAALSALSGEERARLRRALRAEYEVWEALRALPAAQAA